MSKPRTSSTSVVERACKGIVNEVAAVPLATTGAARDPLPVWIGLPKSGTVCRYTGLSRSGLNALILGKNPPVKSVSLKQRYAVRGRRLIHLQSLLDYIEGMATAQAAENSPAQNRFDGETCGIDEAQEDQK